MSLINGNVEIIRTLKLINDYKKARKTFGKVGIKVFFGKRVKNLFLTKDKVFDKIKKVLFA